eukprot:COSAG02_NODE_18138_length_958_cov_1.426077_2_plen_259_part_01
MRMSIDVCFGACVGSPGGACQAEVEEESLLIGTVALLELARAGHRVVQVKEPREAGVHLEFTIHVPTTRRGRPKKENSGAEARFAPSRLYFVSPILAVVCENALKKHPESLLKLIQAGRNKRCRWHQEIQTKRGNSNHSPSSGAMENTAHADLSDELGASVPFSADSDCSDFNGSTSSLFVESTDDDYAHNQAIRMLANVPAEWLPREEMWVQPLPALDSMSVGPTAAVAAVGINHTQAVQKPEMVRISDKPRKTESLS